jgi:hypothetical protein
LLLKAFEYPHTDQGRRSKPLLSGDRAQSLEGFWIEANDDPGGPQLWYPLVMSGPVHLAPKGIQTI